MSITEEGPAAETSTVGRLNAATLLYVATPRPFLGAPRPTWVLVDVAFMLGVLAFAVLEIIGVWWLVGIVPVHIVGVALRARTPHIHHLMVTWITQPRANWRGARWRRPRAPRARGFIES